MYVCICNGLNDRDIDAAAAEAETVAQVYRCLGCRPQCGKCVPLVVRLLRSRADQADQADRPDHAPHLLAAE